MAAVRLPERLAPHDAARERDGRVGEVIERQQQGGGAVAGVGELQQQPAEQQADRQTADVAEKEPRHRLVQRRKAEHAAKEGGRRQRRQRRDRAAETEQHQGRGDRHELDHGHPVDAVHEVDEVDEPHAAEQEGAALEPAGQFRHDLEVARQCRDHRADGDELRGEPRQLRQGAHVIDRTHHREQHRCRGHGDPLAAVALEERRRQQSGAPSGGQGRGHDRDTTALRGRRVMGRAGVRPRHRVAHEPWPQCHGQSEAQETCDDEHRRHGWQASHGLLDHCVTVRPCGWPGR